VNDKVVPDKYKYHQEKKHVKKMDTLICNAYDMLKEYFDPQLFGKYQIPYNLFQECKGIMFLRIWKAGMFVEGIGGTGIVMARNNEGWSNPCAVSLSAIQFSFDVGVEKADDILLLQDYTIFNGLIERGHIKLGTDLSVTTGPFEADDKANVGMPVGQRKSVYAYSFAKGVFIELPLEGTTLSVNHNVNDEFYDHRKIEPKDMFFGDIVIPQNADFFQLKKLLNGYCSQEPKLINEVLSTQDSHPTINK